MTVNLLKCPLFIKYNNKLKTKDYENFNFKPYQRKRNY